MNCSLKLRGKPYVLWRAVDEHGTQLDVLLQKHRHQAAAKRFFRRILRSNRFCRDKESGLNNGLIAEDYL